MVCSLKGGLAVLVLGAAVCSVRGRTRADICYYTGSNEGAWNVDEKRKDA